MAREISVVFLSGAKPVFLTSVLVDDGAKLATVATRVAEKLAGAGVRAVETQLVFSRISEADAAALEANARHAVTSERQFSKLSRVSDAFVEGAECVLVKLVGEKPAAPLGAPAPLSAVVRSRLAALSPSRSPSQAARRTRRRRLVSCCGCCTGCAAAR